MAINLDRFGIKEVADVRFYTVPELEGAEETAANIYAAIKGKTPVIEFDTLKVSNIESTAESSDARGGKGNAALISWDYGREVTITIEDALMSMDCLSLLFEDPENKSEGGIAINAKNFPGTYTVIGKTFARNESNGKDHLFTFIVPKAKIQSETTITMEAEGDPSVIGMTLKALRCKNGDMVQFLRDENDYNSAQSIWAAEDAQ